MERKHSRHQRGKRKNRCADEPSSAARKSRKETPRQKGWGERILQLLHADSAPSPDKPAIGQREVFIVFFVVLTLVVSAVAYSSVPLNAQCWTLGLSAMAFACLFWPMPDKTCSRTPMESWRVLRRFPLFWFGLLLLLLMFAQGLNPAWDVQQRDFYWRIFRREPGEFVSWLPTGVQSPFASESAPGGMNAFRQMIIFGGPWLLLCAMWAGIERRRSFVFIAWTVLITALCLAAWGIQMRISGQKELTSAYTIYNSSFFATFLYQNQAAAWLSLQFSIALALTLWHWNNATLSNAQSGPHLLSSAIAVCFVFAMVCTLSFGGILTMAALLLLAMPVAFLWTLIRNGVRRGMILGSVVATTLLLAVAGVFYSTTDLRSVEAKLMAKFGLVGLGSLDDRAPLRRASWAMVEYENHGRLWTGYGAGSYRWLSPGFFKREKTFLNHEGRLVSRASYSHCDWLQMLVEWGLAGVFFVMASAAWMAWFFVRNIRRWTPVTWIFLSAVALFMMHASMDFLNYSMPVLGLLAFVTVAAARLGFLRNVDSRPTGMRLRECEAGA
jgi:hypothetical protein